MGRKRSPSASSAGSRSDRYSTCSDVSMGSSRQSQGTSQSRSRQSSSQSSRASSRSGGTTDVSMEPPLKRGSHSSHYHDIKSNDGLTRLVQTTIAKLKKRAGCPMGTIKKEIKERYGFTLTGSHNTKRFNTVIKKLVKEGKLTKLSKGYALPSRSLRRGRYRRSRSRRKGRRHRRRRRRRGRSRSRSRRRRRKRKRRRSKKKGRGRRRHRRRRRSRRRHSKRRHPARRGRRKRRRRRRRRHRTSKHSAKTRHRRRRRHHQRGRGRTIATKKCQTPITKQRKICNTNKPPPKRRQRGVAKMSLTTTNDDAGPSRGELAPGLVVGLNKSSSRNPSRNMSKNASMNHSMVPSQASSRLPSRSQSPARPRFDVGETPTTCSHQEGVHESIHNSIMCNSPRPDLMTYIS